MDLHAKEAGYVEVIPPYIVNRESMTATGQLPKFEEIVEEEIDDTDLYHSKYVEE